MHLWVDTSRLELLDRMRRIILALSLYVFVCFVYYDPIFKNSKRNPGKKKIFKSSFHKHLYESSQQFNITNAKRSSMIERKMHHL